LWRVTGVVLRAILAAIIPAITLNMLRQPSAGLHRRMANPKRKRPQAIHYHKQSLS
jgi:hypothetical protein